MKKSIFEIEKNVILAKGVYLMRLCGDTSEITVPGQFVNIELDGFFLRRPISVCDWDCGGFTIIYKVVGQGTRYMGALPRGEKLDVLTGLGNGFDMSLSGPSPVVIGGGAGVPPMYALAKRLAGQGKNVTAVLGFNKAEEIFFQREFEKLGVRTIVTTADGSEGVRGFVTDALPMCSDMSFFYACGPQPMLKAVYNATETSGQLSFEERMGCGFGACMGCTCETKYGNKRICRDGPVLMKEEVIW